MKLEVQSNCPLNKFQPCKTTQCAWFVQLRGNHPQTGNEIDEWACAIAWLPILMVEAAKEVRQGAAATEGARNALREGLGKLAASVATGKALAN